jgi:hypothetical protein
MQARQLADRAVEELLDRWEWEPLVPTLEQLAHGRILMWALSVPDIEGESYAPEAQARIVAAQIRSLICDAEKVYQSDLIRDIFGNPFRLIPFSSAWRTTTAVQLARGMYDSRDFSAMPILADALQDAGCDDGDILNHCRDANQVHVRGCWVVDLVLGKE